MAMSSSRRSHSSSHESYDELIYTQTRIGLLIPRMNKNAEMKRRGSFGRHTFKDLACTAAGRACKREGGYRSDFTSVAAKLRCGADNSPV
jgi:hypothetical protein